MMIIRMFDETRDVDNSIELFKICFGKPMSREYFEWKCIKNPFRTNINPIIVVEKENGLVGALGEVFVRTMVMGTTMFAALAADAMVHPEFRGKDIHRDMLRFIDQLYQESDYRIIYSVSNIMSIRNTIRPGRKLIYEHASHWKILNAHDVFNTVLHNPTIRKVGGLLSPLLWYQTRVPEARNRNVTVKVVNEVEILQEVYNKWKKPDKIYIIRDEKYLNWRFKSHPEIAYQFLAAYVEQEVKGYFVISITDFMGMKRGTIVDYIVVNDNPNIFEPLLNYSLQMFKASSCALVDTWVSTQKWAQPIVKDYGLISSRSILLRCWFENTYLTAGPTNEQNFPYDLTSVEWYITPGDSDTN